MAKWFHYPRHRSKTRWLCGGEAEAWIALFTPLTKCEALHALVMLYLQRDAHLPSDLEPNSLLHIGSVQDEMHDQHIMSCPATVITDLSKGRWHCCASEWQSSIHLHNALLLSVGTAHVMCCCGRISNNLEYVPNPMMLTASNHDIFHLRLFI